MLLEKIQKHYEKQINAVRREMEYEVGQKVLLNVENFTMSNFACLFPIVELARLVFKDV